WGIIGINRLFVHPFRARWHSDGPRIGRDTSSSVSEWTTRSRLPSSVRQSHHVQFGIVSQHTTGYTPENGGRCRGPVELQDNERSRGRTRAGDRLAISPSQSELKKSDDPGRSG